jgi:hypothetical protein
MTVATVLYINELPQLQSAPVTVLARLRDNHATQRREMTIKAIVRPGAEIAWLFSRGNTSERTSPLVPQAGYRRRDRLSRDYLSQAQPRL